MVHGFEYFPGRPARSQGATHGLVLRCILVAAGALAAQPAAAQAITYPDKPIRLIVPYPPGGSVDFTARELAQKLSEAWGQHPHRSIPAWKAIY